MFYEKKIMEILVKFMFWFAASVVVIGVYGYYWINVKTVKNIIALDKGLNETRNYVEFIKTKLETKKMYKEDIQDCIDELDKEKTWLIDLRKIFDNSGFNSALGTMGLSLLVNFFGSKKLDKEKLINFTKDTIEKIQDEIDTSNEVLNLAKSKLAE